ncbi:uncharacterized protein CBL_02313 [Carabus blaptoides fortunei]
MLYHMFVKKPKSPEILAIEKELCSFYEYCKESGFTEEEMRSICKPLTTMIRKALIIRYLKYFLCIVIYIMLFYFLIQNDRVSWHLSAIGRILMIKLLPYWNWEKLANEKCLIPNYMYTAPKPTLDCTLCEAITTISIENNVDPYELSELYIDVNVPVIISDGLLNWPYFHDQSFNLTEILLSDNILSNTIPCELSTNMFSSLAYVDTILKQSLKFKKWFFHFQNCDFRAVKQFRMVSPRPYFLKAEISPVQYNWLLMSANYESPKFKPIALKERITVIGQIQGSNVIRLTPRLNCADECPLLQIELLDGEALVLTSMWDLEYKPNPDKFNVAIILESY